MLSLFYSTVQMAGVVLGLLSQAENAQPISVTANSASTDPAESAGISTLHEDLMFDVLALINSAPRV